MHVLFFKLLAFFFLSTYSIFSKDDSRYFESPKQHSRFSSSTPSSPSSSSLDIDALESGINAASLEVQQQIKINPNATRVLVVGLTGSGKSTLVHALASKQLTVSISEHGDAWEMNVPVDELIPGYAIGHGLGSVTSTPCSWHDPTSNLVYWDCPGFLDSRGVTQEIINSFAIDQLLKPPSRIKILLAMQESDFQNGRGSGALDRIEKLIGIIPDIEQLKQSLCFVVTRKMDTFPCQNKINRLLGDLESEREKKIQECDPESYDIYERSITLLTYLKNTPNKVFSFPAPSQEGIYPPSLFRDKNGVIQSLQGRPVSNPSHCFYFEIEVLSAINEMVSRCGNVGAVLTELVREIHASYRDKNLEVLKSWLIFSDNLSSQLNHMQTPLQFVDEVKRTLPETERNAQKFSILLDRLESSQRYLEFVSSIGQLDLQSFNVSRLLTDSLQDIRSEIQNLIQHKEFLQKQEEKTQELSLAIEEEKRLGRINQEEAQRKFEALEERSRQDKENAEKRLSEMSQRQEEIRQKSESDLQKALSEAKSQYETQMKEIKDQMKAAKEEAERERNRSLLETQMRSLSLSSLGGGMGPISMGGGCGFPGGGSYGGMDPMMMGGGAFESPHSIQRTPQRTIRHSTSVNNSGSRTVWIPPHPRTLKSGKVIQVKGHPRVYKK